MGITDDGREEEEGIENRLCKVKEKSIALSFRYSL
jgi:hypothetical protein